MDRPSQAEPVGPARRAPQPLEISCRGPTGRVDVVEPLGLGRAVATKLPRNQSRCAPRRTAPAPPCAGRRGRLMSKKRRYKVLISWRGQPPEAQAVAWRSRHRCKPVRGRRRSRPARDPAEKQGPAPRQGLGRPVLPPAARQASRSARPVGALPVARGAGGAPLAPRRSGGPGPARSAHAVRRRLVACRHRGPAAGAAGVEVILGPVPAGNDRDGVARSTAPPAGRPFRETRATHAHAVLQDPPVVGRRARGSSTFAGQGRFPRPGRPAARVPSRCRRRPNRATPRSPTSTSTHPRIVVGLYAHSDWARSPEEYRPRWPCALFSPPPPCQSKPARPPARRLIPGRCRPRR